MVDLPEPTRPISATRSPAAILKLMPSSAASCGSGRRSGRCELDLAVQLRAVDEGLAGRALHRLGHDLLEAGHRGARALVLHQEADPTGRPRERAAREHGHGDQRTHGELALGDQVHADDDDGHRGRLREGSR